MEKIIKLYTLINGVSEPFPNADNQIEIATFNYDAKRMGGAPTITATIMHPTCLDKVWVDSVYAEFNGEKYFLKQTPTSSKDNNDARYKHQIELVSERIALDNVYFYDAVVDNTPVDDKPLTNSTKVVFSGDIHEFAKRLDASLKYAKLGYSVVVDDDITSETKFLEFTDQPFSSVLQEIYKQYEIPYYFVGKEIHIGFTSNAITRTFKYGCDDALLSISKNNANYKVVNRCTGTGSEENIPYYYPNEHPLGKVDVYYNGKKDNALIVDKELFAKKVKLSTTLLRKNYAPDVLVPYQMQSLYIRPISVFENNVYYLISRKAGKLFDALKADIGWWEIPWFAKYVKENNKLPEWYNSSNDDLLIKVLKEFDTDYDVFNENTDKIFFTRKHIDFYSREIAIRFKIDRTLYPTVSFAISHKFVDGVKHHSVSHNVYIQRKSKEGTGYFYTDVTNGLDTRIMEDDFIYVVFAACDDMKWDSTTYIEIDIDVNVESIEDNLVWFDEKGAIANLEDYGLSYSGAAVEGDTIKFEQVQGSLIPYQNNLMPPIYTESKGAESFYNAYNDTYISPETGTYYEFENEYSDKNRREHKEEFDYIKPSIEHVTNDAGAPINMFLDFAYDDNDNDEIDENGNYIHPYFYAKLRKFDGDNGFNLFDHASEQGEMTISMTSGNCGACNFVIGVDEKTKKNIVQVNEDGSLARDDNRNVKLGTAQDKQNDTINNEVWIALKKDAETFGMLLPNKSIRPKACTKNDDNTYNNDGDTFVITNISFPQSYITAAEKRLEEEIIKYMSLNNSEKFNFSIKFSRIFLAENPAILAQLDENARIKIEYDGKEYELYVNSFQYKNTNNEALPEITVELAESLSTGENALQRAIGAVEHSIMSSVGSIDFYKSGLKYFIRKDVEDWSQGLAHFTKGATFGNGDIAKIDEKGNADLVSQIIRQYISTPQFIDGFAGTGFKLWLDENGKSNLTIDNLTTRETHRVFEMLVTKLRAVNGGLFISAANGVIKDVRDSEDGKYFVITFEQDSAFEVGDYVRCQVMSGNILADWWVEVAQVDNGRVWVAKSEFEGAMPLVGQEVVLDGSRIKGRQNAIHISASEDGQPRIDILNNISTKSHDGCLRTRLGNLDGIYDIDFGEYQPHGDGLYSDNAYLKGEFILANRGKSIDTLFAIQDGKIQSSVKQTQAEAIKGKTMLYNASFTEGLDGWQTSNEENIYYSGEVLLFSNGSMLKESVSITSDAEYENIFFVHINDGWIKQPRWRFVTDLDFSGSNKFPLYFSANVRCKSFGMLTVKIGDNFVVDKMDINPSDDFIAIDANTTWNGNGDFELIFTGAAEFYGITIYSEKTEVRYATLFEQTERIISATAALYGENNELLLKSGLVIKPESAGLFTQDKDGNVATIGTYEDGIVRLTGNEIRLEGNVTANGGLFVDENGLVTLYNAKFETDGTDILNLDIDNNGLTIYEKSQEDKITYLKLETTKFTSDGFRVAPRLLLSGGQIEPDAYTSVTYNSLKLHNDYVDPSTNIEFIRDVSCYIDVQLNQAGFLVEKTEYELDELLSSNMTHITSDGIEIESVGTSKLEIKSDGIHMNGYIFSINSNGKTEIKEE